MATKSFDFSREIELCATINIDWSKLDNKVIMITGATGMVGKYLCDVFLHRNKMFGINTKIIAVGRSEEKFRQRFSNLSETENIIFWKHDVQEPSDYIGTVDYVIHMASNTHPNLYASDPIGTEMANILGTYHLLNMVSAMPGCRFVFTSSGDVYGDNRSGKPFLEETDCGYIDCNTLRAGYIEGKRASEALCNAYREAKGVDFVTARLCRIYGPTMQMSDSKAISQFVLKAAKGEDIILKSKGTQTFSYLYIYDVVTALLWTMTAGESGHAYNIADNDQFLSLLELAETLAEIGETQVKYDLPDELEAKGASKFNDVRLDSSKLKALGWSASVDLTSGLRQTVKTFHDLV